MPFLASFYHHHMHNFERTNSIANTELASAWRHKPWPYSRCRIPPQGAIRPAVNGSTSQTRPRPK
ncbi:hypothetical protein GYMLUDRAFT_71046 [Collybiopsis luxurians FD-317 M1]|nr:hypothetical protein GYMLUDRAFT_71046 [Collybiopsis luxurians FD-317 M1]